MPSGIYLRKPFSEQHRRRLSKKTSEVNKRLGRIPPSRLGIPHSKETKRKMSESHKGNKSYLWKGGITPLIMQIRNFYKSRQWRSDVFTRDNFTCQDCGDNKSGNLEAHHIKKFSTILHENKITTIEEALNCEKLWDINNGITYCSFCHAKKHSKKNLAA